ncbi:MAG: hypothetical protein A2041_00515 [Bacteroidetes bacterium GWA2_31_9b]|nr:MAG: hypothetical protein A2041_00515 [Bacteroidetes bacterium GWA2_31_9b]
MNIIIVDDNKSFRAALKHLLEKNKDYEIICEADNGIQALELLNSYTPELVLMDIEMPIMDSIKAIKLMLTENNQIKFIAITEYSDKVYLDEIMGAGFHACVLKSDVFDEIDAIIEAVCNDKYTFPKGIMLNDPL